MKPTIIIDCDPGHDDVMAILLGGRTTDLRGITTVHGNASLEQTTRNARQIVEFSGLTDVPIAEGMGRPLVREPYYAPYVHGETGLDGPTLAPPTIALHEQHAVDFLIAQSHALPDLHLVPIGPLTNVAVALKRDPSLPQRIKQISLMGGSLTFGNVTPAAEFNIWCDPEAAHVVFTSGIPIKMIGLNVTHQVLATPEYRKRIRSIGSTTSTNVADMLDFYSEREASYTGLAGGSMHDPLAVAALIDPDILTFESMHVAVELRGTHTAGMTLCDGRHLGPDFRALKNRTRGETPNAEVAVAVRADRFWELFLDVLATYP
ncbi:MAG TPA: nucleoside hydrolase [Roseiflexaceae bacterium]|nr:nucleoside hydrolase [Roseiflexaceae bacterium]HMP40167.1 nucleoside hydrolase [Roseiflexaceae bacterium]